MKHICFQPWTSGRVKNRKGISESWCTRMLAMTHLFRETKAFATVLSYVRPAVLDLESWCPQALLSMQYSLLLLSRVCLLCDLKEGCFLNLSFLYFTWTDRDIIGHLIRIYSHTVKLLMTCSPFSYSSSVFAFCFVLLLQYGLYRQSTRLSFFLDSKPKLATFNWLYGLTQSLVTLRDLPRRGSLEIPHPLA